MKEIEIGKTHVSRETVTEALLACRMGSGDLPVYATPAMAALMENAAMEALKPFLEEGETSVGVALNLEHTAATPSGKLIEASAQICAVDRRKVSFLIAVRDEAGEIGKAAHDRFVVNVEKFLDKANTR